MPPRFEGKGRCLLGVLGGWFAVLPVKAPCHRDRCGSAILLALGETCRALQVSGFFGWGRMAAQRRSKGCLSCLKTQGGTEMNGPNQTHLFSLRFASLAVGCGAVPMAAFFLLNVSLRAQQPDAAAKQQMIQEKVAALKQSLAQNQAALKKYSWTESTEISLKGEVKKREQKECHYGPDGKVVKTPIAGGDPPQEQKEQAGGRRGRR